MEALVVALYWLVCFLALFQAVLVLAQTWEHRRFARQKLSELDEIRAKGPVLLIVPCRGAEPDLERNIGSVLEQDYGDYVVRFVVESTQDPAYAVIRRVMAAHPQVVSRVIVAGSTMTGGQKVHNLLAATEALPEEAKILAFADSDACLRPEWLRALVSRLDRPQIVAATGYRWFVPSRSSLANHLTYSLNSNMAVFLAKNCPTVVWGGSWAIRRDQFQSLALRDAWRDMLDEDLVAARVFRRARLGVAFEPACMVASPLCGSLGDLFRFARRQYFLTRFYSRGAWRLLLLLATLTNVAFWGSLAAAVAGWWTGAFSAAGPALVAGALYLLSGASGYLRQDAATVYFPHLRETLRTARRFEIWAGPLVFLANWVILLASAIGHEVRWRGIAYQLHRDGRIAAVRRDPEWPIKETQGLLPRDRTTGQTGATMPAAGQPDWTDTDLANPAAA